jgi:hypothetical protein
MTLENGFSGVSMSATEGKQIQLAGASARRLEELAQSSGVTEGALVEEALELLFREREKQPPLESETGAPIVPEEARFVVGTPVQRGRLVKPGARR